MYRVKKLMTPITIEYDKDRKQNYIEEVKKRIEDKPRSNDLSRPSLNRRIRLKKERQKAKSRQR
jgi:hypothetical protein